MDFGLLWKQRGFVTKEHRKNGQFVADLLDAMRLVKQLAVMKVKANGKLNTSESRGDLLVDSASKTAAQK